MQNHNDDTVFLKNIPLTLFERVVCDRELETEQNCNILTPTLMAISVSFPFSWAAQSGAWGPSLSGCYFSLPHLISNSSDPHTDLTPTVTAPSGALRTPSSGCCFLYSIITPTLLIPKHNRGSRGPLLPGAVFSTASFSNSH